MLNLNDKFLILFYITLNKRHKQKPVNVFPFKRKIRQESYDKGTTVKTKNISTLETNQVKKKIMLTLLKFILVHEITYYNKDILNQISVSLSLLSNETIQN